MNIVFDIETTGLPPKNANWETDFMDFPYIVQLSWKRSDVDEPMNFIVKPDGYKIPDDVAKIHGITTEIAIYKGYIFENIIKLFINDCYRSDKIIGHNIYFDTSIVKANILRLAEKVGLYISPLFIEMAKKALHKDKRIDTMRKSVQFCKIPFPDRKGFKWPTLNELHYSLFNEHLDNLHNAKNDVLATEKCFNKLCDQNVIQL